ncbi:hypothetical protein ACFL6C_05830 [Myxococcota bacterium]
MTESSARPKVPEVVAIEPPLAKLRARRAARFPEPGQRSTRYTLPTHLSSTSPIGYRVRESFSPEEAQAIAPLLALERPRSFTAAAPVREEELFEECSLGILSARQSTSFRGQRLVLLGPTDSAGLAGILRRLDHADAEVLENVAYSHVVLTHPYRTPFTALLTVIGHKPLLSLLSVPWRVLRKRVLHTDDIPTVGYLQHLHVGVLADAMERATVIASCGCRRAQVHLAPFCGVPRWHNRAAIREIEDLVGLTAVERSQGWRVTLVAQVGEVDESERLDLAAAVWRKIGANLLALRSERIVPGVNPDFRAPEQYHVQQDMDVPEELTIQAGRAAYNAFAHWTGCDRERAKDLLLLDRIDVLTPGGEERLRGMRSELDAIARRVERELPLWADLPTRGALRRAVGLARKAFGLTGQRIYIVGLSKREIAAGAIDWELAVVATGAAAARSALLVELAGCVAVPEDCDLLAGICLMAGPVHQNDIGKQFYGFEDLLCGAFRDRDPTSLLVWTLKAKTVADPIGNEEQLLNPAEKAPLVGLRPGPHEVVTIKRGNRLLRMRQREDRISNERAFADVGNFATDPVGRDIPGNCGAPWPKAWREEVVWPDPL